MRQQRGRRAFTLVELLVVMGIIAVLVAILLPVVSRVRRSSTNTVCAARLRTIAQACSAYLIDYKRYPQNYTNDLHKMVFPHDQQSRTLNQLSVYLDRFPEITNATNVSQLPPTVQCPWAEMSDLGNGDRRVIGNGDTYWYTGYAYYAQLEDDPNYRETSPPYTMHPQQGVVLKRNRNADRKGTRRGVLYGDAVVYFAPFDMWNYTHYTSGRGLAALAGFGLWRRDTRTFHGRHLAWSDGSVEWVNGTEHKLDLKFAMENSSYSAAGGGYWWWY
jgi:prepilin-type N-terminal cleavage/methylation domain-containing protein